MTTKTTEVIGPDGTSKPSKANNVLANPGAKASEQPERTPCACGCGGFPSKPTSRYLPGHDAKHHSALRRAAKEQDESKPKPRRRGKAAA